MGAKNPSDELSMIEYAPQFSMLMEDDSEQAKRLAAHRVWLHSIRHERPNTAHHFKVGIYIRYFNQTKYENYLAFHKKQYMDTLDLCPNWDLVDFYIDQGSSTPYMENAPEWSRLIEDCFAGKVDLIITQKISNVSREPGEVAFCSRMLAAQDPPVGIYFVSEDVFTLASYFLEDLLDPEFFPSEDWQLLPDLNTDQGDTSEE